MMTFDLTDNQKKMLLYINDCIEVDIEVLSRRQLLHCYRLTKKQEEEMSISQLDQLGLITTADDVAVVILKITEKGREVATWLRGRRRRVQQKMQGKTIVAKRLG